MKISNTVDKEATRKQQQSQERKQKTTGLHQNDNYPRFNVLLPGVWKLMRMTTKQQGKLALLHVLNNHDSLNPQGHGLVLDEVTPDDSLRHPANKTDALIIRVDSISTQLDRLIQQLLQRPRLINRRKAVDCVECLMIVVTKYAPMN